MANVDRANGFTPVGHLNGSSWNGAVRKYSIPVGYATALYKGDLVYLTGESDATGKYPVVAAITNVATHDPVGPIVSIEYNPENLSTTHSPASTAGYAFVADSPDLIMEAQADGVVIAADMGLNCSPSVTPGVMEVDHSELAATETLMLQVLRLVDREDNALGQDAKVLCRFNRHQYACETGCTGV
jgi:hypothetical protein